MVEETKTEEQVDYKFIATVLTIGALIGLILIFTLGRYSWQQMTKATAEANIKQEQLKDAEKRLDNLKKLSGSFEEIKVKNETVLAALPEDKDISALFTQFENVGKDSGLNITSVEEETNLANTSQLETLVRDARYVVTGKVVDYGSLKNALTKFESALRILSIKEMEISGDTGTDLDVKFNITTYLRGDK